MKAVLMLSLFIVVAVPEHSLKRIAEAAGQSPDKTVSSPVEVVEFKYSKSRQVYTDTTVADGGPAREVIPQNKNYARNARVNDPIGVRDPNEDTLDGRHAALEKITQEANRPQNKPVDGYAYRVKVENASDKPIEILFWEYEFIDSTNPKNITRRQFLCGIHIKPNRATDVKAFSVAGPGEVVSVGSLEKNSSSPFQEKAVINRIEFADGTIWQRKDWNFAEIGLSYRRVVATPWGSEMCRGL